MWLSRKAYERLAAEAALAVYVPKLEVRAEAAEAALVKERDSRIAEVRHVVSMLLRREHTYPLPPTAEEKSDKQTERDLRQAQPARLNPDQQARLDASVAWGLQNGFTKEQAEKAFMSQLATQMDE